MWLINRVVSWLAASIPLSSSEVIAALALGCRSVLADRLLKLRSIGIGARRLKLSALFLRRLQSSLGGLAEWQ